MWRNKQICIEMQEQWGLTEEEAIERLQEAKDAVEAYYNEEQDKLDNLID